MSSLVRRPRGWKRGKWKIDFDKPATTPAQRQMGPIFVAIESHDYFFQQRPQKLLAIAIGGGGRGPDFAQIGTKSTDPRFLFRVECARTLPAFELCHTSPQRRLELLKIRRIHTSKCL